MSVKIGDRDLNIVLQALFQARHYHAAGNMLKLFDRPAEMMARYLFSAGKYPTTVVVRTPVGPVTLNLNSSHDLLTVNEIFCRHDYEADANDRICVDFGSNVGISAAYFLSRGAKAQVYLFEPLPFNTERLRKNLAGFEGSYQLQEVAVGEQEGEVEFGWEATGRYGGVGKETGNTIKVKCVDSNEALRRVLSVHGQIDILKIDIETLERPVTERIPVDIAQKIRKIYVESTFPKNPLENTHRYIQYGAVAQFFRKE